MGRGSGRRPGSLSGIIHLRAQLAHRSHLGIRFTLTLLCLEMTGMEAQRRGIGTITRAARPQREKYTADIWRLVASGTPVLRPAGVWGSDPPPYRPVNQRPGMWKSEDEDEDEDEGVRRL